MQVGYYKPVSQWSKGEYADASNKQDDLAVMTDASRLMYAKRQFLAFRPDDHGATQATATPLALQATADPARSAAAAVGNVERTGDVDVLRFAAGPGSATLTLSLTPSDPNGNARANVDLRVQIFAEGSTTPLATLDPAGALASGALSFSVPTNGTYYASLASVGDGADASVGYSTYGSLGEYKVEMNVPTPLTATEPR